jgi:hypothetical protein
MLLGKIETLAHLQPLLEIMPSWPLEAMDEYNDRHDDTDKVDLGAIHRALYVQKKSLARMRRHPAVVGAFRPVEDDQLEALILEGEPQNISVLLKKARTDHRGRIVTSNSPTDRQRKRLLGDLLFGTDRSIPVVLFYLLREPADLLSPVIDRVCIGEERPWGMDWYHTLWSREDGMSGVVVDGQPNLPFMPETQVRLRRPDADTASPARIGTMVQDRENMDAAKGSDGRQGARGGA